MAQNLDAFRKLNVDTFSAVMYFSDADCEKWMQKNASLEEQNAFHHLGIGAAKGDLFRMLYLYHSGGFWVDADLGAFRIAKHLHAPARLQLFDVGFSNLSYMVVGSTPGHPLIKETIAAILVNISSPRQQKTIDMTGPRVLQRCFYERYHTNSNKLRYDIYFPNQSQEFAYSPIKNLTFKTECYKKLQHALDLESWQTAGDPRQSVYKRKH